jgi:hypothetical protein
MKQIGAKSTSGPEAILIAAIKYWITPNVDIFRTKILSIASNNPNDFDCKSEIMLGKALVKHGHIQIGKVLDSFWSIAQKNEVLKFMIEEAVKNKKNQDLQSRILWAREFVRLSILSEFGSWIKEYRKS